MKKNFFFASLLIGAYLMIATPTMAQNKTVKLTTAKEIGQSMIIAVNHNKGVTVDWGDGNKITYETNKTDAICDIEGKVKGKIITVSGGANWHMLSCKNCGITDIDLSQAKDLQSLYCQHNQLDSLNVSGMTQLTDLDCSQNNISKFIVTPGKAIKEDLASLEHFNLSNNKMTGKYNYKLPNLKHLNIANNEFSGLYLFEEKPNEVICNNNKLSNYLNLNSLKHLNVLVCSDNNINSLIISNNAEDMTQLYCSNNQISAIDLGQADGLLALVCDHNKVTQFDLSKTAVPDIVIVNNNALTFSCLPGKSDAPKYLSFVPQDDFDMSEVPGITMKNGVPCAEIAPSWTQAKDFGLDLKKESSLSNGRLDSYVEWYSVNPDGSETPMVQRKSPSATGDYYANRGIHAFFNPFPKAYVKLRSKSYGFIIKSMPITIGDGATGIENVIDANDGLTISVANGAIVLNSTSAVMVSIYTIDGKQVWKNTVSGETSVNLPKGVYVINGKKVIL